MARQDVIDLGVAAVQAAEVDALKEQLGVAFDAGVAAQVAGGSGLSQADVDAAVAAAQAVDAQALADAVAVKDAALEDLKSQLLALAAKEGQEAGVISGLQDSVKGVQDALAAIVALLPAPQQPTVPGN